MGWRDFWSDVEDDVKDFGKALEDNPVDALVAFGIGYYSGNPSLARAAFAAGMTTYGNMQQERANQEARARAAEFQLEAQGRDIMVREPVGARRFIYGENKVSGNIVFMDVTGDDNEYLHLVVVVADHEVEQFCREPSDLFGTPTKEIHLNDEDQELSPVGLDANSVQQYVALSGRAFDDKDGTGTLVRFKFYDGTQTLADADLVAESDKWTTDHKLEGVAYFYARLKWSNDAFPTGIPNISMRIKGKKVKNLEDDVVEYSTNPAYILYDYLASEYAFNIASADLSDEFDEDSFIAAANVCDETVATSSGDRKRYTCNGVVSSATKKAETINQMLMCMTGDLIRTNGKWYANAGEHRAPVITLDEDDCRGALSVLTKQSRRDRFNAVRGTYIAKENKYKLTDYPEYASSIFADQDGEKIVTQLDLPMTNTAQEAQRLAKIHLLASRQEIVVNYPAKLTAFRLRAGDTVQVNNEDFGWDNKLFRVQSWTLVADNSQGGSPSIGVDLLLRETAAEIYDFDFAVDETVVDPAPDTNLPSPFTVGNVSLSVTDELRIINNTAITVLVATVTGGGALAEQYQVEARRSGETDFIILGRGTSSIYELPNVEDGVVYEVRAIAYNGLGVRSDVYTVVNHEVIGKTAPPADVENLSVNLVGSELHLDWDAVPDLDLDHYKVRHSNITSGGEYQNAVDLIPYTKSTSVTLPARNGTYFVRAVDTSGFQSDSAAAVVVTGAAITTLNVVDTSTQHPNFTGTKTDCAVDTTTYASNTLLIGNEILFDEVSGDFDDATGNFDDFRVTHATSGTYEFDTYIDLSQKYTSRLTVDIDVTRIDFVNVFDDAEGNFDDRAGNFDGDETAFDDTNVEIFVATTDDDPSGTPTWSDFRQFKVGDYTARAFKFKAELSSNDNTVSPGISSLEVSIDMPDSVRAEQDLSSGTGAKAVTFSPAFQSLQGIAIAAEDMATGDYYAISSKSRTGFTINFYNAAGIGVDRTFDYLAKGYGEVRT